MCIKKRNTAILEPCFVKAGEDQIFLASSQDQVDPVTPRIKTVIFLCSLKGLEESRICDVSQWKHSLPSPRHRAKSTSHQISIIAPRHVLSLRWPSTSQLTVLPPPRRRVHSPGSFQSNKPTSAAEAFSFWGLSPLKTSVLGQG